MVYERLNDVPWFPNHDVQIGVTVGYLIALSMMSVMVSSRFPLVKTIRAMTRWEMSYSKITILIALAASWCYIFVGGVLNLGVGLSQGISECSRGIFLCTWFYTTTKLGVYLFLMERAFIVRGGGIRLKSWHYRFNFLLMACWLTVFILLETGRIYALRGDGVCIFGWQWWALIPLMSLDVFVNFYLLAMFVVPLFRNQFTNAKLRTLAIKSMWTSVGSVIATISNLVMLIMIDAPGWLCLSSCGVDIFANAVLLFYMTRTLRQDDKEAKATWTAAAYQNPDSERFGDSKRSRHNTIDDDDDDNDNFEMRNIKGGTVSTTCEHRVKGNHSEPSISDSESQRHIVPENGIYVSRKVDYDSNLMV
ncbi:hypothetical protein DIS24_g7889 [Lasiodiplodia hormozganensis]|uniref:Transmembrane protein n=1 Tax=Lasiodiplodia hormozganensis TaxID=869390 RepID=A0AA39Y757_9PEZI|nr:hypothetical protein DIS24_g7889 [Lasiodiplodia hormozganensis]